MSAAPKVPLEAEGAILEPAGATPSDLMADLEALADLGAIEVEIVNGVRRYKALHLDNLGLPAREESA